MHLDQRAWGVLRMKPQRPRRRRDSHHLDPYPSRSRRQRPLRAGDPCIHVVAHRREQVQKRSLASGYEPRVVDEEDADRQMQ